MHESDISIHRNYDIYGNIQQFYGFYRDHFHLTYVARSVLTSVKSSNPTRTYHIPLLCLGGCCQKNGENQASKRICDSIVVRVYPWVTWYIAKTTIGRFMEILKVFPGKKYTCSYCVSGGTPFTNSLPGPKGYSR